MRFVLIEVYPIGTRFRFENPIVQIEHQSVDDLNATLPNLASKFALILEYKLFEVLSSECCKKFSSKYKKENSIFEPEAVAIFDKKT